MFCACGGVHIDIGVGDGGQASQLPCSQPARKGILRHPLDGHDLCGQYVRALQRTGVAGSGVGILCGAGVALACRIAGGGQQQVWIVMRMRRKSGALVGHGRITDM
ncbi:hypothetical protein D3C72_1782900 [compost metagenome]